MPLLGVKVFLEVFLMPVSRVMKIDEKSMFIKMTQEHPGDVWESLEMF